MNPPALPNVSAQFRSLLVNIIKEDLGSTRGASDMKPFSLSDKHKLILNNINGFIVICNYTTGFYEYISEGVTSHLGYDVSSYAPQELTGFMFSIIEDDHRKFLMDSLLPVVLQYFNQHSTKATGTDYRYTCSLRVKNVYGKWVWLLIDTVIIEVNDNGFPTRTLINCTDINSFKKDDCVYYNIMKKNHDGIYELMLEGVEGSKQDLFPLTQREIEIINLISNGNTNKEISEKLEVTVNTVKTHRKNIMKKTKCRGIAELTNFAFSRGLL
jgi:DNA-binding CsgD family transcriptional regulator